MYFVKTPNITSLIYPSLLWKIREKAKNIYITFDDGPDRLVTPKAMELLEEYNAKATFFCVGERVKNNPDVYKTLIEKGHAVGNHTFNHLNGKKVSDVAYFENINKAAQHINTQLFRPPYGKIRRKQVKKLKSSFQIVMWSVLTGDFDKSITKEDVLKRSIRYTRSGSIVVFHDNPKFEDKMLFALEGFLAHFSKLGYHFKAITPELLLNVNKRR